MKNMIGQKVIVLNETRLATITAVSFDENKNHLYTLTGSTKDYEFSEIFPVFDNIEEAEKALNNFCANWCLDIKKSEELEQLYFKCKNCIFSRIPGQCLIRDFFINCDIQQQIENGEIFNLKD